MAVILVTMGRDTSHSNRRQMGILGVGRLKMRGPQPVKAAQELAEFQALNSGMFEIART